MKIALLSAANCIHTIRWANGLAGRGVEVHLITCHPLTHKIDPEVTIHRLSSRPPFSYFTAARSLRSVLDKLKPDLLNAHYATGYGTLARLSRFSPYLLSVWGSDVYDFPDKSRLHRYLLKSNLRCASAIASTSHCMAAKTKETFPHPNVYITPFGIDENAFQPKSKAERGKTLTLGTIKTLSPKYGIDTLLQAFATLCKRPDRLTDLTLEITGEGADRIKLESLAHRLGIGNKVIFNGYVTHDQVPEFLNKLDVYVALSRLDSESFGVAILEASACELPVVVSNVDGLSEVVIDGHTGIVVPKENPKAAANALEELLNRPSQMKNMGKNGRAHVLANYTWRQSVEIMIEVYRKTISNADRKSK